jgi:hypothetical protein
VGLRVQTLTPNPLHSVSVSSERAGFHGRQYYSGNFIYCPIFRNSAFCAHRCVSHYSQNIVLYSINLLGFLAET